MSRKFSVTISGHRTSISLEPEFWTAFGTLCAQEKISRAEMLTRIDQERTTSLSSAVRLWVLEELSRRLNFQA